MDKSDQQAICFKVLSVVKVKAKQQRPVIQQTSNIQNLTARM